MDDPSITVSRLTPVAASGSRWASTKESTSEWTDGLVADEGGMDRGNSRMTIFTLLPPASQVLKVPTLRGSEESAMLGCT